MSLYATMAATALSQINDKGRNVTVRSKGVTEGYDVATDTYTAGTDSDVTAKALFTEYKTKDIDGEVIQRGDKKLLIAASSLSSAPTTETQIVDGSDVYSVIGVETVEPGDTAILYKVQVRR